MVATVGGKSSFRAALQSWMEDDRFWRLRFRESGTEWGPINTVAVLASEQLQIHAETFKKPLAAGMVSSGEVISAAGRLRWDMIAKVVDLKLQEVSEFYRLLARPAGEA